MYCLTKRCLDSDWPFHFFNYLFAKLEFENSVNKISIWFVFFLFFFLIGLNSTLSPLYIINVIIITAMLVML